MIISNFPTYHHSLHLGIFFIYILQTVQKFSRKNIFYGELTWVKPPLNVVMWQNITVAH